MIGITAFAVSTVLMIPAIAPPAGTVCSVAADAAWPDWCSKTPPGANFTEFRRAMREYVEQWSYANEAITQVIGAFQTIGWKCDDSPPVDPNEVEIILSGLDINGRPALERANAARNRMLTAGRKLFRNDPNKVEAIAAIEELGVLIEKFGLIMMKLDTAGDQYRVSACDAGDGTTADAADELVVAGQRNATLVVQRLISFMVASKEDCDKVKTTKPMSDKKVRKTSGSKAVKTKKVGDMTVDYPTSMDVGGKGVWLPLNVSSTSPSAYLQLEFKRGTKPLEAVGGGTADTEFGLLMKLPAKLKPGQGTLVMTIETEGANYTTKHVTIKLK